METSFLTEEQILKASGGSLDKLVKIWHREVNSPGKGRVEIVLRDRRDGKDPVNGGILTEASIQIMGNSARLVIWYDSLELYYDARIAETGYSRTVIDEISKMLKEERGPGPDYNPVSNPERIDWDKVSRQIGRWLLKFRGYKKIHNENRKFYELETFLNLECAVPPLYSLFDEADYDWSCGEYKRLVDVLEGLENMEEPSRRIDRALNAMRIDNIMDFSVDSDKKKELESLLEKRFKLILESRDKIDTIKKTVDITSPDGNFEFKRKLVLGFRMPGTWTSFNEVAGII